MPPPIEIGWVKEAPAPVLEIVSDAGETTDVSVVGKFPDPACAFAFTPGPGEVVGAVVDETTEASSVAKCGAALAAGEGDGEAAAIGDGSRTSAVEPFC